MRRFMFAFTWKSGPDVSLATQEHEVVKKLIANKKMEQMFLASDRSRGWLIMLGESDDQAWESASTLPFFPIMQIEVTILLDSYP